MKESKQDFIEHYPVARAAYVIEGNLEGYRDVVRRLSAGKDSMKTKRATLRERYLSKAGEGQEYTDLFTNSVKSILSEPNPRVK